ncbi:MAG: radical SAM family heme chaperone HemW [Verrucomicrobiota bacterium]
MLRSYRHLYIHVPFCAAKCDYCAFYSVPCADSANLIAGYLDRLEEEIATRIARCRGLQSIFIGGGTPSILSPSQLRRLLRTTAGIPRDDNIEITVECNPSSLDAERIAALAGCGVNRLSLGIQSWDADLRRTLGRHTELRSPRALVDRIRAEGIERIGADLIYAIPGQTTQQWCEDLKRTADLGVQSLSAYALSIEEGTRLAAGPEGNRSTDEESAVAMWHSCDAILAPYGLQRYEVSNFAVPGCECRHNERIWHGDTYLGCGPAACSFDGESRTANPADLDAWLNGAAAQADILPPDRRGAEILAFGLRTTTGWTINEYRKTTGFDPYNLCGDELRTLCAQGLLECTDTTIRPTQKGLLFADTVCESLLR